MLEFIYLKNHFILVKKAYRQLALRYHPDRTDIDQKEEAKTKFQIIGKVYAILSDEEKRNIYDDTGTTKETLLVIFSYSLV